MTSAFAFGPTEQPRRRGLRSPLRSNRRCRRGHRGRPARRRRGSMSQLVLNSRKLPFVEPKTRALGTAIDLDPNAVGKPAPFKDLPLTARTTTRLGQNHRSLGVPPNRVQAGCTSIAHPIKLAGIKPNATAPAVASIDDQTARALFSERPFASRTFKCHGNVLCGGQIVVKRPNSSFVIRHSSFVIRHSSFVIRHSPVGRFR